MYVATATRTTLGDDGLGEIKVCEYVRSVRPQQKDGSGVALMWLMLQNSHVQTYCCNIMALTTPPIPVPITNAVGVLRYRSFLRCCGIPQLNSVIGYQVNGASVL